MRVILTEKVPSLGNVGEIVKVSDGHARNYLIPNNLAVLADGKNKKQLEDNKRRLAKKVDAQRNAALEIKKKIDGIEVELFKKVGGSGKLFGSVTNTDLAKELALHEVEIERRLIILESPIKSLGTFDAKVKVFTDVEAQFKVTVKIDPKQAQELKAKQIAAEKKAKERKKAEAEQEKSEELSEENKEEKSQTVEVEENTPSTKDKAEAKKDKKKK